MTREEARILIEKTKPKDNSAMSIMLREALDMAIKALEQEPCDIFDKYGNYKYPSDVELTESNTATSMPCEDAISGKIVKEQMIKYGFHAPDMTVTEFVEGLLPVTPQPKTGHWQKIEPYPMMEHEYRCSECYHETDDPFENFCSECGARMVKLQGSEREKNE